MDIPILITGGTKEERLLHVKTFIEKEHISTVDQISFPDEGTVKIEHARQAVIFLSTGPIQSRCKSVTLLELQTAGNEAQTALLKLLEEPPVYSRIIITAPKKESLLSTILSRVTIKKILTNYPLEDSQFFEELNRIVKLTEGERFYEASTLTDSWISHSIVGLRQKIHEAIKEGKEVNKAYSIIIQRLNRALWTLQTTNTSPRLLMENLIMSLPKLDPTQ